MNQLVRNCVVAAMVAAAVACSDPEPSNNYLPCQCAAGTRCDASNVCRTECQDDTTCGRCGACQSGLCQSITPCRCTGAAECSDGDPCNGEELCDTGVCAPGTAHDCGTSGDACFDNVCANDQGVATCNLVPSGDCPCSIDPDCDDNDPCNGAETCQAGNCHPGTPHDCPASGVPCRTNTCVNNGGTPICQLVLAPLNSPCDDLVPCTDGTCDASGNCAGAATVCDDSIDCTTDTCNPSLDACEFTAVDAACNDNKTCTVDTCAASGCVFTPDDTVCEDGDICTDDLCDPAQGDVTTGCRFPNNSAGCDDGDGCTENDTCLDGTCGGQPAPSFETICNTDGFCMDGLCLTERHGQHTPGGSPCTQDWYPAGIGIASEFGTGALRFVAMLNARFRADHATCPSEVTYTYARRIESGTLVTPPNMAIDGGSALRVPATTTCVASPRTHGLGDTYAMAWGDIGQVSSAPGAGSLGYSWVRFDSDSDSLTDELANHTVMGWPTSATYGEGYRLYVGGRHASVSEGVILRCFDAGCGGPTTYLSTGANTEVSAIHVAVDPAGSQSQSAGLIAAVRGDDGSVQIEDDEAGTSTTSPADGDSGPFPGVRIHGAVARAWDDVLFFGTDGMVLECTNPPAWTCTQLPELQLGWSIRGGAVTASGHLLLVGPFSFTVTGGITVSGNRLLALPAGVAAANPDNWVVLPMESNPDTRVTTVAVLPNAIQALGETTSAVNGSRVLIWSYEE